MYVHEEIVIKNPSAKLLALVDRMREHKRKVREELRNAEPMFVIHV